MGKKSPNTNRAIAETLLAMLDVKNDGYGNSFQDLIKEFGIEPALFQILHKSNRIKAMLHNREYDSLIDTLFDLAGYCVLTLSTVYFDKSVYDLGGGVDED